MKCPSCGVAELVKDTRDLPYTYKGESTIIPDVTGEFCPACDEVITGADESRRTMALMMEFNKQVNASIVDPGFIASVRKKLALDQKEASEIFGGGINAFSRYENGKTKPPLALVKLLKVLDCHLVYWMRYGSLALVFGRCLVGHSLIVAWEWRTYNSETGFYHIVP